MRWRRLLLNFSGNWLPSRSLFSRFQGSFRLPAFRHFFLCFVASFTIFSFDPSIANAVRAAFMNMDIDYTVVNPGEFEVPKPITQKKVAMLRMFGVTSDGHSVCANVFGFLPYMYVPVLRQFGQGDDYEKCNTLRKVLNVRACRLVSPPPPPSLMFLVGSASTRSYARGRTGRRLHFASRY